MTQQTIVAHFESRDKAEDARQALIDEGVAESAIRLYPEMAAEGYSRSTSSYDAARDEGGFWASLANLFLPDEDRYAYAEGMSRGGATISVSTDSTHAETVSDILEHAGAVDMDESQSQWRQEGWTGYASGSSSGAASGGAHAGEVATSETMRADMAAAGSEGGDLTTDPAMQPTRPMPAASMGVSSMGASSMGGSSMGGSSTGSSTESSTRMGGATGTGAMARGAGDEQVIPVVEERLKVGKRETEGGRVKVRSYVVETPVEEHVDLRREHVDVSRRPVDRPVTAADEALFQERTIEAEERMEEAVVSKEARVREELVVRKDVGTETETVRDTVRRTEVDIEDERIDVEDDTTIGQPRSGAPGAGLGNRR